MPFFEVKAFLAKRFSNLTFKVLPNESWLLLIGLRVLPLLSNHTNPERFLILAFLAIPKPFGWPK